MKGDFSIDRFDATRHFNRVLKQQGRVDLDSDWNEQASIEQHKMRNLVIDLFGRAAGPRDRCGFGVIDWNALTAAEKERLDKIGLKPAVGDFLFGPGRYYVDGILVENEREVAYSAQPEFAPPKLTTGKSYLVYLDIYERHITYIEDDSIREVALGGPDTCTRVQTAWQVRTLEVVPEGRGDGGEVNTRLEELKKQLAEEKAKPAPNPAVIKKLEAAIARLEPGGPVGEPVTCESLLKPLLDATSGAMRAQLKPGEFSGDPCVLSAESRYRGLENQLYRVEIHRPSANPKNLPPTFKWSRENGSVVARWVGAEGKQISVASSRGFAPGEWIELSDVSAELGNTPGTLLQIVSVDGNLIQLDGTPLWSADLVTPAARRWDQQANDSLKLDDGAIPIEAGTGNQGWIELEHGIEVQFSTGDYRSGDYWLIPARVVGGDIVWPRVDNVAAARLPNGVTHHYAPLARIDATATSPFVEITGDCRCRIAPLGCLQPE
jgi:hypothetical protein